MDLDFDRNRFGYRVVYDGDLYDAIDFASEHGFGYIVPDLMIPRFWPDNLGKPERRRIREYADSHDVKFSFHAPSDNLNLVAPYPEVREGVIERMRLCVELARDLEAQRLTIHPSEPPNFACGGSPGTYLNDHREVYWKALKDSILKIASIDEGVQICVENEPLTPFIEGVLEELITEGENVFLTLDVPKAFEPSKGAPLERVEAFYRRNIARVKEAHLHNRRFGGLSHDSLVLGEVDLSKYLSMLWQRDVHFTLEIRPRENAFQSLLWLERNWDHICSP